MMSPTMRIEGAGGVLSDDTQNQQIEALKGRIETLEQEVAKTR